MSDTSDSDDDAGAPDEIALLLADPELREFLTLYLAIPDVEGRARVRRVAAELTLDGRPRDLERRKRLGLSPPTAKKFSA